MYLAKAAFASAQQLYLTMGHEFLHAGFNQLGMMTASKQHAAIYKWEAQQSTLWKLRTKHYIWRYSRLKRLGFSPYNISKNPNYFPAINTLTWPIGN